jgi:hypothetical protein
MTLSNFEKLRKELRRAIERGDTSKVIMAVMKLGEHANSSPDDWKMSPRGFYEMADVLRQMRNDGHITDGGQDQILRLLQGGADAPVAGVKIERRGRKKRQVDDGVAEAGKRGVNA